MTPTSVVDRHAVCHAVAFDVIGVDQTIYMSFSSMTLPEGALKGTRIRLVTMGALGIVKGSCGRAL